MASIEREVENALLNVVSGIGGVNFFTSERGTARTMPSVTVQAQIGSEELVPFSGVFKTPATITYVARADTTARADFDAKFYDILEQLYRDPDLASYLTTNSNITFYVAKVTGDTPAVISQNRTWSRAMTLDIIATSKFLPSGLSGLSLWLKADAGVVLDGSNVISWADQSGNGKNATAIQFPTYSASAINSKPALVFANNAYLTTSNIFNGSNPRTMFAVYYIDSEQSSNTVIGQSNEDSADIGTYFMLQSRIDLDSSPYLAGYNDDLFGPSYVNQQLLLGMADYDGTTARLFKNGTQANSEAKTYNTFTGEFYIGAFSEAGTIQEKFGGKIAEIVVYNRVLSTQERQQVEGYLNAKYAIY